MTSVEDGYGNSRTVNPGDIFDVHEETRLHEKYPSQFSLVTSGVDWVTKRVTISSAEILALNTTPKTLLAAPGAGYYNDVYSVSYSLDYGSAAYATNTTIETRYTNGSGAKVCVDSANLLTATADKVTTVKPDDAELVNVANAAVVACVPSGNPATGDSPVYATILYRVLPV